MIFQSIAEHGRIVIEGTVPVRILSLDENGQAFVIKSEVPLRGALDTSASPEALQEVDLFTRSAIKDFWIDTINSQTDRDQCERYHRGLDQ